MDQSNYGIGVQQVDPMTPADPLAQQNVQPVEPVAMPINQMAQPIPVEPMQPVQMPVQQPVQVMDFQPQMANVQMPQEPIAQSQAPQAMPEIQPMPQFQAQTTYAQPMQPMQTQPYMTPPQPIAAKKSKKGLLLIVLLFLCLICGIVSLALVWLNINPILKSLDTIKKDDSLVRVTQNEVGKLDTSTVVPLINKDNKVLIALPLKKVLAYTLDADIADSIGAKSTLDGVTLQIEAGGFAKKFGVAYLTTLPVKAEDLKDIYMNIDMAVSTDGKQLTVTKSTFGNTTLDAYIAPDFNKNLASYIKGNLKDLGEDLENITLDINKIQFTYALIPADLSKASSLKGKVIADKFDLTSIDVKTIDAHTYDLYFTAEQWLAFSLANVSTKSAIASYISTEIKDATLVYYFDLGAVASNAPVINDLEVKYESYTGKYFRIALKVNAAKNGFTVDGVSLGNKLIDKYFSKKLSDYVQTAFGNISEASIKEMEIKDGMLRVRVSD